MGMMGAEAQARDGDPIERLVRLLLLLPFGGYFYLKME
jgi:hypothetical protein